MRSRLLIEGPLSYRAGMDRAALGSRLRPHGCRRRTDYRWSFFATAHDHGNDSTYKSVLSYVEHFVRLVLNERFLGLQGWTPLHAAASGGHRRIVSKLLEAGGAPNLRDKVLWSCHLPAHVTILQCAIFSTLDHHE